MDWTYGGLYQKYEMDKELHIGTGIVKVHDIFKPIPDFMKQADFVISDPPYNSSALSGFYTKAGIAEKPKSFDALVERFFEVIDEISPKMICLEVGEPQTEVFLEYVKQRFSENIIMESYYYGNKRNVCNMIFASNIGIPECVKHVPFFDEEKFIKYLCENVDFECVADPFMGLGLVAYYANKNGKKFVGTELNKYRLAVCVERVVTNQRGKIR